MTTSANYTYLLLSFFTSMAMGLFLIPAIVGFCKKKRLYDMPNKRKIHKCFVPRLGGICFMPCMVASSMLAVAVFNSEPLFEKINVSTWALYFFIGLLLIYATGAVDDLMELSPRTKFVVQFFAASILPLSGLYINDLYGLFGVHSIPYYIGTPLTVIVIVFIVNAINLIDGIDGLASGLALIALIGFLCIFIKQGMWSYAILITGLSGALCAFMRYNIFGKTGKDKTFMGDAGSLTLGFILATLFVRCSMNKPQDTPIGGNRMLLAGSLLTVPAFDAFRIVFCRYLHHRNIFRADGNHIHHKLLRTGITQHKALFLILVMALLFIAVNCSIRISFTQTICLDVVLWCIIHRLIDFYIKKNNGKVFC